MVDFKEFISTAKNSERRALPPSSSALVKVETSITTSIAKTLDHVPVKIEKKEKFAQKVSSLVSNEKFLTKLSDRIGKPQDTESEDDFVERSKKELRKMLFRKFGVKG